MTTKQFVEQTFSDIQNYWGVNLDLEIVEPEKVPYGAMTWGKVFLTQRVVTWSEDVSTFIVGHEIGHRACLDAPQTEARRLLWDLIATEEGIKCASFYTNVFTDLMTDYQNIVRNVHGTCPWHKQSEKGLCELINKIEKEKSGTHKAIKFLRSLQRTVIKEGEEGGWKELTEEKSKKLKLNSLQQEVYNLLCHSKAPIEERIRVVAKRTKHLFKDEPRSGKERGETSDGFKGFGQEQPQEGPISEEEAKDLVERLTKMYGDKISEKSREKLAQHRVINKTFTLWRAYANIIPIIQAMKSKRRKGGFQGYAKWRLGTPINQLDLVASISKYGVMIPGTTTIKQNFGSGQDSQSHGAGNICVILDSSGSMCGTPFDRAIECCVGLIETAKFYNDFFSAIDFSGGKGWCVEPNKNYSEAVVKVCELQVGGTTELYEAACQALEYAKRQGKQCSILLSDSFVWDIKECVSVIKQLTTFGKVLMFMIGSEIHKDTERVFRSVGAKVFCVPDSSKSFSFEALKEFF